MTRSATGGAPGGGGGAGSQSNGANGGNGKVVLTYSGDAIVYAPVVLAAFGADVTADSSTWIWTDITSDVRQADNQTISISPMGRSDEFSQAQPASCTFQLDNSSGNYTAYSPASAYYPNVRRNTPIQVLVSATGGRGSVTRFFGYANGWVPSWDSTGNLAIVTVSASGVLRRLSQGTTPFRSPLYRVITASFNAIFIAEHWPLEDASGSTQAANSQTGGPPMRVSSGTVSFGANGPPGSAGCVDLSGIGQLTSGSIPVSAFRNSGGTEGFTCEVYFHSGAALNPSNQVKLMTVLCPGSLARWTLYAGGGLSITLELTHSDGSVSSFSGLGTGGLDDGDWHRIQIQISNSGGDVGAFVFVDGAEFIGIGAAPSTAANPPASVILGDPIRASGQYCHLSIWDSDSGPFNSTLPALNGYAGETATDRLTRLCNEENLPLIAVGNSASAMGPQGIDTFLNLLRECETADQGVLLDGLSPGLTYITRQAKENLTASLTIDAAAGQVDDPFEPVDDDQRTRNFSTVSRKNGSSATYEDVDGPMGTATVGTYDDSLTVNLADDTGLANYASWLVHEGTVEGFRYPTLNLDLIATPALQVAWLATGLQERIDVTNVSTVATQHPAGTVSLLLEGYSETLSPFAWTVTANCSPYQPWEVIELAADTGDTGDFLCHLDTDDTTLTSDVTKGATSLSLTTNSGPLWTTATDDFPFYLNVGGVKVKVTAISGSSSPQTATVDSSSVIQDLASGSTVSVWNPPVLEL